VAQGLCSRCCNFTPFTFRYGTLSLPTCDVYLHNSVCAILAPPNFLALVRKLSLRQKDISASALCAYVAKPDDAITTATIWHILCRVSDGLLLHHRLALLKAVVSTDVLKLVGQTVRFVACASARAHACAPRVVWKNTFKFSFKMDEF